MGVAVAANSSRFVDVGAEHPVNHFPISLPPTAKPRVLFPWQQDNAVNCHAAVTLVTTEQSQAASISFQTYFRLNHAHVCMTKTAAFPRKPRSRKSHEKMTTTVAWKIRIWGTEFNAFFIYQTTNYTRIGQLAC